MSTETEVQTPVNRIAPALNGDQPTPENAVPAVLVPANTTTGAVRPFDERTLTYAELKDLARVMAMSTFFKDAEEGAKAFAKMLVGREMGIPVTRALVDVQIIQGKPCLSANLVAALIKRSGKYKYKILTHTDTECSIDFQERIDGAWESCGPPSSFTIADATRAGLTGNPTWKKFPKNMLFSRAITNGARQYCGDVCLGSVYTPDELDPSIEYDAEGNIVSPAPRRSARPVVTVTDREPTELKAASVGFKTAVETTDGEVIDTTVASMSETVATLKKEIEDLALATDFDLPAYLRKCKVTRLESLGTDGLKNIRNTLRLRFENK